MATESHTFTCGGDLPMGALRLLAIDDVVEQVERALARGAVCWAVDPVVPGVVGLVVPGTTRAAVVVYLDDRDFEVDEVLLTQLADPAADPAGGRAVAWGRDETAPCQRGTTGCAIDHDRDADDSCETW